MLSGSWCAVLFLRVSCIFSSLLLRNYNLHWRSSLCSLLCGCTYCLKRPVLWKCLSDGIYLSVKTGFYAELHKVRQLKCLISKHHLGYAGMYLCDNYYWHKYRYILSFLLLYYNFHGHVKAKVVLIMTLFDLLGGYLCLEEPAASYSP